MASLNPRQRAAVNHDGNLKLTSCPGSGKTRVVVAKLIGLLAGVSDTPRRIGCITHTNAAVHEIETRVRERTQAREERSFDIATIHSFCLSNVLLPFRHLLTGFQDNFEIVTAESDWLRQLVPELNRRFGVRARVDDWANTCRGPDGLPRVQEQVTQAGAEFLIAQLDDSGRMTMGDILFHASDVIRRHAFISRGVASKYAWLLIDEFQDTSDTQLAIFRVIASHARTKFLIVGDPEQSIYGFNGARPGLMEDFGDYIGARPDVLDGNYRSSAHIVAMAERLIPRAPPMVAVGEHKPYPIIPRYTHASTTLDAIWDDFLPLVDALQIPIGRSAILASQWIPLFHLSRALRTRDVPVIGPGARPYRRTLEFAAFAEHACAFIEERTAVAATKATRALFLMLLQITGRPDFEIYSASGKRTLYALLHEARAVQSRNESAIPFLRALAQATALILHRDEWLTVEEAARILAAGEVMVESIESNRDIDPANLSVADLSLFARPSACLTLMTIHAAKGREFDAVALIDLHESVLPNWRDENDKEALAEARRLLYVGTTRARKLLCYYTDAARDRPPSRFLAGGGLNLL